MRRLHLIELHEQPWYPNVCRKIFQQSLGRCLSLIGAYQGMVEPFGRLLRHTQATTVLDMCSGSAEPVVQLRERLEEGHVGGQKPTIVLSDLFPNLPEYQKLKQQQPGTIDFYNGPVNALHPPVDAPRVRTMFSALHHFQPEQVEAILRDAARNADGIGIFESTGRTWSNMLSTLFIPFLSAGITSFMLRPYKWSHLAFGLFLPVIPVTAFFDGVVSNLRTYTEQELRAITAKIDEPSFTWEVGSVDVGFSDLKATYLLGWRTPVAGSRQ